ncbi:MAG: glycolate oxidase binding subunit [Pseudomonadota bacterium]|jgi:glycolate oxidase FAD binding subunit
MDAFVAGCVDRVRDAASCGRALRIRGGGTKDFYGNLPVGEVLDTRAHAGIVSYEPSELVVSARTGTSLAELESLLASQGQMLAFEPPHFGAGATVGGCIAAGLAGPRRASAGTTQGSVRDFLLGATLLDGRGRVLRFGGTVMKNVAGYDVTRALAASMGFLGLILEVSLKVLPRPRAERTLRFELDEAAALDRLNAWAGEPLPLSASCWEAGVLHLRLAGALPAVDAAARRLGGETADTQDAERFWRALREQQSGFFAGEAPLWRFALPSTAAPLGLEGGHCIEWGGAQRWLRTDQAADVLRARATSLCGHATLFRGGQRDANVFTPLSPVLLAIHQRLKDEFDPARVFNPGRLVPGL